MTKPFLLYHQHLLKTSQLIEGRLLLIEDETIKTTYIATSGQPWHQARESISVRGRGPIPSNLDVANKNYTVTTTPIYLPNARGINGNFYKINPFMLKVNGVDRGDFGIHFDANVPGSAGCIVIRNKPAWEFFENEMKLLSAKGVKEISLLVSYAR